MAPDPQPSDVGAAMGTGWAITSTLIAGMLTLGGLGYLADRLIGLHKVFLPIGIVLGAVAGIYAIYMRYGREQREQD